MANEKRLIDANALKKEIVDFKVNLHSQNQDYASGYFSGLSVVEGMLAYAPTVDAVEVVHGRWKEWWCDNYLQYFHKCSACGVDALTKEGTMYDEVLSNYCPNCGVKMDGQEKDGNLLFADMEEVIDA